MRKFQLLILAAAIVAGAIWWGLYRTHHTSSQGVAALLPRETLALVHIPDFNRSRDEWHRTDLYQLWKEPAVQEFLAKPRSKVATEGRIGQTVEEISSLEMKDAFVALVSIEHSAWEWEGGFRCAGNSDKAAKTVEEWKAKILGAGADLKRETIDYQGRQIQNESAGIYKLATAWAGQWFFFANDLENLKALLDRADGRVKNPATALMSEENFIAATKRMPGSYSAMLYARPAQIADKAMPAEERSEEASVRYANLRQVRSICTATAFDGGRIHDRVFVGMPKTDAENLSRASLPIANKETFLYGASILDLRKEMGLGWQSVAVGWLGGLKGIVESLSAAGVTLEDWKAAFGSEVGLIGSWPANAQWPSLVAAMPVRDSAKANQVVTTFTNAATGDQRWTHKEKDGAHYYSTGTGFQLFSFSPTVALSDRMLVLGADRGSVEAAMKRTTGPSELATTRNFQTAERMTPTAQQAFAYFDPALFYARFDATLRPLLAMGSAFVPALAETVDVNKLPSADVVTRHLSPTVMSQSYQGDGYVSETIGSVPLYQTVVGGVTAAVLVSAFRYSQERESFTPGATLSVPTPSPTPDASPSPP